MTLFPPPFRRFPQGFTLIEMLVVFLVFGIVSAGLYQVFYNFLRSHFKIDDRLESVTEGWQIIRVLNDDLTCCDLMESGSTAIVFLSDGKLLVGTSYDESDSGTAAGSSSAELDSTLAAISSKIIYRRKGEKLVRIEYRFDEKSGDVSRYEENKGLIPMIKNRCASFTITPKTKTDSTTNSKTVWFTVRVELENMEGVLNPAKLPQQAHRVILETNIFPPFLNLRVRHKYVHKGSP